MKKAYCIALSLIILFISACAPSDAAYSANTAPTVSALDFPSQTVPAEMIDDTTMTLDQQTDDRSEYEVLLGLNGEQQGWIGAAVGCLFEKPEDIDLFYLFYMGIGNKGWQDISDESAQLLIEQGFTTDCTLHVMPVEELEIIMQDNFGISFSDCDIPKGWVYIPQEDAYCTNLSDAFLMRASEIVSVRESEDGIVSISYIVNGFYNTQTEEFYDSAALELSLKRKSDGWVILSNVLLQ